MWLLSLIVRLIMRVITLPMLLKYERKQAAAQLIIIPDALIESILVQLPVNTLLKFRRLSKQWNSTITSPAFATMHLKNLLTPSAPSRTCAATHVVYLDYSAQNRFFPSERAYLYTARIPNSLARVKRRVYIQRPQSGWMDRWTEFNSSCNGLVCMARLSIAQYLVSATISIQVWNLATRKHKQVASLPASLLSEMSSRACVTMRERIMLGFGYDSNINDFKIVFMYQSSAEATWQIQVLSLKSNIWKSVYFDPSDARYCSLSFSNSVSVSGNVYWPVGKGRWCMILKFILGEERFEFLSFPENEGRKVNDSHNVGELSKLGCHNGSLYIFIQKHYYVGKVDIWILSMASEMWRRVATFTIPACHPLGFDCNGHVIMCVREGPHYYHSKLLAYLLKEKKFVKLDSSSSCEYFHLVQMETLVCP